MPSLAQVQPIALPHDQDRAAELTQLCKGLPQPLLMLVTAVGACSPYLCGVITREHEWLKQNKDKDITDVLEEELSAIQGDGFTELGVAMRQAKRRIALLAALADIGGLWSLMEVTGALTKLADRAVQAALHFLVAEDISKGKLPNCTEEDIKDCAGLVVIAMGKMGAHELNYSSDIDLIMLFDETRHAPEDYADVRASFIRITQRMVKLLSENTGEGYVFRTDLRLRPDASVTPVCMAMEPAEHYYESFGRTWERAAYIKARPCAGDIAAGEAFLARLTPFIWRKYLDFAAIQDAHDMRLRIREHKGLHGAISVPGHDMKLGQGGIREIEFFTQTRQIICGGRDTQIRQSQTLPALQALADHGWIEANVAAELTDNYIFFRTIEHRIQMLDDAQTHTYPTDPDKRSRIANLCGYDDPFQLESDIHTRLERVKAIVENLYSTESPQPSTEIVLSDSAAAIVEKWDNLPALRSDRAQQIFARLRPDILAQLTDSESNVALLSFDRFLSGLPAGVQIFSLFEANPQLLDLLLDICATAPALADYLGQNTGIMDAFVSLDFFERLATRDRLLEDLQAQLDQDDFEANLDIVRRWVKEKKFQIGVHMLRRISNPREAAIDYSNLAEAALTALFPVICRNFARRYGPPPGRGMAVVAMGKLGSREMTATSDLDLIMIYDADGEQMSSGPKPLAITTYFARLTQAVLSAVTVPTAEGALYEVDMRLRPSGRQGPVATSLAAFRTYQQDEAWTWEHLALMRARVLAGEGSLVADVEQAIAEALSHPRTADEIIVDVKDMRSRLIAAKANSDPWEVKDGAGRLTDIELLCQCGGLIHGHFETHRPIDLLPALVTSGWLSQIDADQLARGHQLFTTIQHLERLAVAGRADRAAFSRRFEALLVQTTGFDDVEALENELSNVAIILTQIVNNKFQNG